MKDNQEGQDKEEDAAVNGHDFKRFQVLLLSESEELFTQSCATEKSTTHPTFLVFMQCSSGQCSQLTQLMQNDHMTRRSHAPDALV